MRKRTVWALLGLTSLGAVALGLDHEASADAGIQDESVEQRATTTRDAAPPAVEEKQEARSATPGEDACPTTEAAKLNMVLRKLHMLNRGEIEHARLAQERSQTGAVKEFAQRMITDHTEADRKLTAFAEKNDVSLDEVEPTDPIHAALHAAVKSGNEALEKARGVSFDAAYIGMEIAEHRLGVSVVRKGRSTPRAMRRSSSMRRTACCRAISSMPSS